MYETVEITVEIYFVIYDEVTDQVLSSVDQDLEEMAWNASLDCLEAVKDSARFGSFKQAQKVNQAVFRKQPSRRS